MARNCDLHIASQHVKDLCVKRRMSTCLNESSAPGCLPHTHLQDAVSSGLIFRGSQAAPIHQLRSPMKIRALTLWQQKLINNTYYPLFHRRKKECGLLIRASCEHHCGLNILLVLVSCICKSAAVAYQCKWKCISTPLPFWRPCEHDKRRMFDGVQQGTVEILMPLAWMGNDGGSGMQSTKCSLVMACQAETDELRFTLDTLLKDLSCRKWGITNCRLQAISQLGYITNPTK